MFQFDSPGSPASPQSNLAWNGLTALWRRLSPLARRKAGAKILEHLETLPLTTQSSVALIRLHDETLLLGITPHNITLLAKAPHGFDTNRAAEPMAAEGKPEHR